jgi:hypothetical protein
MIGPAAETFALVQRLHALHRDVSALRERLLLTPPGGPADHERVTYLGVTQSLEAGLLHALRVGLETLKAANARQADAWLRDRLRELEEEGI